MTEVYRLKVTQVEQVCLFELTYNQGLYLKAQLPYPSYVEELYRKWQRIYLRYYQSFGDTPSLRGRKVTSGQMEATTDWHSQLVQAETKLLMEFFQWLSDGKLIDIRRVLSNPILKKSPANSSNQLALDRKQATPCSIDLLITCDPISLGRLPWELWELGSEFSRSSAVRISRSPVNVRTTAVQRSIQGKAKVLVILGDETGLDFGQEREALSGLGHLLSVSFVGWRSGMKTGIKQDIFEAIQAPSGWDMLLFFGHSNEAKEVGGQIAIAPSTTISIQELSPCLRQAQANGLQFALFNSCKGIDIADALIDMGLNQVAVMREPIHNRVAQVFLIQFLQRLSQFDDVHTALKSASQALYEKNLKYPSAYLAPSLFRHGNAALLKLQPSGWRVRLSALLPESPFQWAALSLLATLSFTAPATQFLLAHRLRAQSIYRQAMSQPTPKTPPVLLVQIDRESIRRGIPDGVSKPMNRAYLAEILDKLSALEARVVGVDYLLDGAQIENDDRFAQSSEQAVDQGTWLVFSSVLEGDGKEVGVRENLASLNWVMQGHVHTPKWYLRSLPYDGNCKNKCPHAYLLAMTQLVQQDPALADVAPSLQSQQDLRQQLLETLDETQSSANNKNKQLQALYDLRLSMWSAISQLWNQRWLHPILDFSIPPEQVFVRVSAHQLLDPSEGQSLESFNPNNQVVIIASGGYGEAGTDHAKAYSPLPPAVAYWHRQSNHPSRYFTGGEANAYAVHHFLNAHYVKPIPDVLLAIAAAFVGANLAILLPRWQLSHAHRKLFLTTASLFYGWFSLQIYVGLSIVLPYLIPVSVVWIYCIPSLKAPRIRADR